MKFVDVFVIARCLPINCLPPRLSHTRRNSKSIKYEPTVDDSCDRAMGEVTLFLSLSFSLLLFLLMRIRSYHYRRRILCNCFVYLLFDSRSIISIRQAIDMKQQQTLVGLLALIALGKGNIFHFPTRFMQALSTGMFTLSDLSAIGFALFHLLVFRQSRDPSLLPLYSYFIMQRSFS